MGLVLLKRSTTRTDLTIMALIHMILILASHFSFGANDCNKDDWYDFRICFHLGAFSLRLNSLSRSQPINVFALLLVVPLLVTTTPATLHFSDM
jgi:hypothetical protein